MISNVLATTVERKSNNTRAISGKVAENFNVLWTMKQKGFNFFSKTVVLGITVQAVCKVPTEIFKDDSTGIKISISLD